MFSTLVVPLDGSPLAERALPYAIRLAQAQQGRLILMRAALAAPPRTLHGSDWERDQTQAVAEAERYLTEIAESVAGQVAGVEVFAPYGRPSAQILETAGRFAADGVVMATHGRTGLPHFLYGSVTEAVLAEGGVPVFVVHARPGEKAASVFAPHHARVLVTQNGSAYDASALDAALQIIGPNGELVLVSVIPAPETVARDHFGHVIAYLDQQEEADRFKARDYLNAIAAELRNHRVPFAVKVDVRVGDPASGITLAAIEDSADLIVMATHGRTGIRRALVGSVAGTVLRTGPTPVLLVHPHPVPEEPATAAAGPVELEAPFATF
jgi:nucleotide-binding universal stress UspA family protein